MKADASRREFLAFSLAGAGLTTNEQPKALPAGSEPLRYRSLGKTGLKVTAVGFGCMITSDQSVIERAADLGINYFDTARGYQNGNNEKMVGAALKGRRDKVVLSTKTHAETTREALAELNKSLSELATDHVDIWYLHAKSKPEQISDALMEAAQLAKRAGKIRFTGVSTHGGQTDVIASLINNGLIDVVLAAYNFTMDAKMNEAVESAHRAGIGVVAMKVMAGGFRRNKPDSKLHATLQKEGAMAAALRWVLKNPNIHTAIPSITDMEQLDENIKAMTQPFSQNDEAILARHLENIRPLYCRMCGECDGTCPKGMPVADVLRYLTYAEGYGQFALGRERFQQLPPEIAQVRCGGCSECAVSCPHGVRVSERLIRAQELFA